jgi:hypothetical protein
MSAYRQSTRGLVCCIQSQIGTNYSSKQATKQPATRRLYYAARVYVYVYVYDYVYSSAILVPIAPKTTPITAAAFATRTPVDWSLRFCFFTTARYMRAG